MSNLHQRLSQVAEEQNVTISKICEIIGYNYNTLYLYKDPEKKLSRKLKSSLENLSEKYGYNIQWLITGYGSKFEGKLSKVSEIKARYKVSTTEAIMIQQEDKLDYLKLRLDEIEDKMANLETTLHLFISKNKPKKNQE